MHGDRAQEGRLRPPERPEKRGAEVVGDGETRSLARASVDVRGNLAHPRQQLTPMLAQSPLEQHQLEAVPCGMALRDRIPAAMLDGHAGFVAHRFEAYLDLGRLSEIGRAHV